MCIYECAYTHTHTIPYSATWPQIGFPFTGSLHFKMENAQETKQVANQTLCSLVIQYAVSSLLKWQTILKEQLHLSPFFSGAHHYSGSKGQTNTRRPHVIPTFPLRREDVQRLPSSACTLTYIGWTTSKENWKSIGNYKAGNLPGITEKEWDRAHGWGMVTDGYNWSQKERDGAGKELHSI